MAGLELILGVAIGYIAFTDNGHAIGNKLADIAVNQAKKTIVGSTNLLKAVQKPTNTTTNDETEVKNDGT